jgi:hypothetical protein
VGGEREGRGGRGKGGEMTQTLYAHMNKRKKIKFSLTTESNLLKAMGCELFLG